jgi:hypothetical protein
MFKCQSCAFSIAFHVNLVVAVAGVFDDVQPWLCGMFAVKDLKMLVQHA